MKLLIDKMDGLDGKIDKMDTRLDSVDITLAKQSVILDEHVKRSNMLEAQMEPVKKHVTMVNGVLKFLGIVSILLGIATSGYKLLR